MWRKAIALLALVALDSLRTLRDPLKGDGRASAQVSAVTSQFEDLSRRVDENDRAGKR